LWERRRLGAVDVNALMDIAARRGLESAFREFNDPQMIPE
jgi:hypothetical protein